MNDRTCQECTTSYRAVGGHVCPALLPDRMASMLRRLEWGLGESKETDHSFCPWCTNMGHEGHEPDCELAALLRDLP